MTYDSPFAYVPPVPPRRRFSPGVLVAALAVAVVVGVAGLGMGWVWAAIAPRLPVEKGESGSLLYVTPSPEELVASEGVYGLLGLGAGLVFAILAWVLLRRYRGAVVLVGLVLGSLVGAYAMWWMGHRIAQSQFDALNSLAAVGDHLRAGLGLRMSDIDERYPTGVAALQALAAAIVYTLCAGFSARLDLGRSRDPEYPQYSLEGSYPYSLEQGASNQYVMDQNGVAQVRETPQPAQTEQNRDFQLGPGLTGSSDSDTGTART